MAMRISKDRIDLDDKTLQKPVLKDYGEAVVTETNSGSSYTIDLQEGNVHDLTLTDNCALTFANPSPSGIACSFTLILRQDSTGSRTVTWPAAVKWLGNTEPTLETVRSSVNILTFLTINGGSTWFGTSEQEVTGPVYPFHLDYGYFVGGEGNLSQRFSTIDRLDYANDTATAVARGSLSAARIISAATGNNAFGYCTGDGISITDRVDYANDTATTVQRGTLTQTRRDLSATGNYNYGYVAGGLIPGLVSTIDRLDYANDTATAVARGPLSQARSDLAATGTSSYGYFGGGGSRVDRLDYANDTATASVRGPLSAVRWRLAATGTSAYGYFGGGYDFGPFVPISRVDRIDYSNDTVTASVRGPLSQARDRLAATGTSSYGYFGGGRLGSPSFAELSTVDRIDYANDTVTAVQRGPLSAARYSLGGLQNCPL